MKTDSLFELHNLVMEVLISSFDRWVETSADKYSKIYCEAAFVIDLLEKTNISNDTYNYINNHFKNYLELLNTSIKAR